MVLDFLLSLDLRCFTCGNSGPDLLDGGGGLIFRNGRKVQVVRYCWVRPTGDAISCQISGFVVETADIPLWSDLFVFFSLRASSRAARPLALRWTLALRG